MENLHVIINIIDNYKEHMSDNDYLQLMNSLGKIGEVINSKSYSDIDSDSDSEYDSDNDSISIINSSDEDDEQSINSDDEQSSDDEICVIDVDLLLERINKNEIIFNNFMKENNLPEEFRTSKFNIIYQSAYNYITNNTCDCDNDYKLCYKDYNNCKNYQNFILVFPMMHLFVKNECPCCVELITEDINKFKLFQFDGKIKLNKIEENIYTSYISSIMKIIDDINSYEHKNYVVLLLISMLKYIFNYGDIIVNNEKYKESIISKLNESNNSNSIPNHILIWSNIFNFNPNILNIMMSSLQTI